MLTYISNDMTGNKWDHEMFTKTVFVGLLINTWTMKGLRYMVVF